MQKWHILLNIEIRDKDVRIWGWEWRSIGATWCPIFFSLLLIHFVLLLKWTPDCEAATSPGWKPLSDLIFVLTCCTHLHLLLCGQSLSLPQSRTHTLLYFAVSYSASPSISFCLEDAYFPPFISFINAPFHCPSHPVWMFPLFFPELWTSTSYLLSRSRFVLFFQLFFLQFFFSFSSHTFLPLAVLIFYKVATITGMYRTLIAFHRWQNGKFCVVLLFSASEPC